ncbi:MAG: hypothetical protein HY369_01440 [Candidatus Aenigmarchaeota archaeon]|nr:hypothetical protein [Candidatus Aenigmarchaeota archaeon]
MGVLGMLAGALFIAGFVPYIRAVLLGRTRPAKASWIVWAVVDTITFAGMLAEGTVNGQIVGTVLGLWVVLILALRYGIPGWTRTDKWCLGGAALGLALWATFSDPILAILMSQIVTVIGSVPTFVSAWSHPEREDKLAWTLFWVSCVITMAIVPEWTMAHAAQPIAFFAIESTMMAILFLHPSPPLRES